MRVHKQRYSQARSPVKRIKPKVRPNHRCTAQAQFSALFTALQVPGLKKLHPRHLVIVKPAFLHMYLDRFSNFSQIFNYENKSGAPVSKAFLQPLEILAHYHENVCASKCPRRRRRLIMDTELHTNSLQDPPAP